MIVGAGIIGTYLGSLLGDEEIWESKQPLQEKACSGLLSVSGLKAVGLPYDGCVVNELNGAYVHSENETLEIRRGTPQALLLDRMALQRATLQMAEDNGCAVQWGKAWNGDDDRFVIGADGALSAVAKSMGVSHDFVHAYQVTADYKCDPDMVHLYFSKEYAPGFFAWIIPEDERRCRIGIGTRGMNPKKALERFARDCNLRYSFPQKEQSAIIPVYDGKKTVDGNKALIGDAAGQVKATTGGGIIFGCKCARVLKDAVGRGDLSIYEKGWRILYGKDLDMHLRIRKAMDGMDYDGLIRTLNGNGVPELVEKYGDMEHPGDMIRRAMMKPGLWPLLARFA